MSHAIAASGGSQKYFLLCGYIKAMNELGLLDDVTLSVGTSAGALLSAGLASVGPEGCEEILGSISGRSDVMKFCPNFNGLYSFEPLRELLEQYIPEEHALSDIEAVTCSVDLLSANDDELYVSNYSSSRDEFIDSVLTSSAVPPYIQDLPHRPGVFDGGLRTYVPVGYAAKRPDIELIYTLLTSPVPGVLTEKPTPPWYLPRALWYVYRYARSAAQKEITEGDLAEACGTQAELFIVAPKEELNISYTDFRPEILKDLVPLGYDLFMEAWREKMR